MSIYVSVCLSMCLCLSVYLCVCVYIHIHICVHIHTADALRKTRKQASCRGATRASHEASSAVEIILLKAVKAATFQSGAGASGHAVLREARGRRGTRKPGVLSRHGKQGGGGCWEEAGKAGLRWCGKGMGKEKVAEGGAGAGKRGLGFVLPHLQHTLLTSARAIALCM